MEDRIVLTRQPIDVRTVRAHLGGTVSGTLGGICVFEGCTRLEHDATHGTLAALEYEAYDAMALRQLHGLAAQARARWPILALAIEHRVGRVAIGESSVIIGVATAHRDEAFAACRWLIDTLKRDVPIWKKECWSSGATTWVGHSESARGGDGTVDET